VIPRSRHIDFIAVIGATAEPDARVGYVADLEEKMGKLQANEESRPLVMRAGFEICRPARRDAEIRAL